MAKKHDKGMQELLDLLKTHPELIDAIVIQPESLKKKLKSKKARQLLVGADVDELLHEIAEMEDGVRMVVCSNSRTAPCNEVTRFEVQCYRSTGPAKA